MARKPSRSGTTWSASDVKRLRQLARGNTPTRLIALKMDRTPSAVQSQASKRKISLKPVNQSPYGTRGKR